jgi:AraC-like DNA-binding protein
MTASQARFHAALPRCYSLSIVMPATTAHFAALRLLRHAVARGVPPATVQSWLGVAGGDLERPGRLPAASMCQGWFNLYRALDDEAVGARAAQEWTLPELGLLGFCLSAAPTVRAAIETAVRLTGLVTDAGFWRLSMDRDRARVVWSRSPPSTLATALSDEMMVAGFVRCYRELSGSAPLRVEFQHRCPRRQREHEALMRCGVRFQGEQNVVVLDRAQLDIVPKAANPALWRFLTDLADGEVRDLQPTRVAERTRQVISQALGQREHRPQIPAVARNLGMSERTLRRRLHGEDTSFRRILSEVCLERAAALMDRPGISCTEIAFDAGFADVSAFGRAWKRSRGASPSTSRRASPTSEAS